MVSMVWKRRVLCLRRCHSFLWRYAVELRCTTLPTSTHYAHTSTHCAHTVLHYTVLSLSLLSALHCSLLLSAALTGT